MTSRAAPFALSLALLLSPAALAQREGYAYLSWVGSEVSLLSTADDDATARPNTPILAGDRLVTGTASRAEAILADGNVLRVDLQSSVRFDRLARTYEAEDVRNALFLERGAVSLEHHFATSSDEATRIDTDDATIVFPDQGLVRVETGRRGTEVYVASGRAEVYARSGRATLRAGQYAFASDDQPLEVDWLEEPRDRFTRFVEERRAIGEESGPGSQYVSADYSYDYAAADLDRHGSWVYVSGAGSYCWRPTVSVGWRPYAEGYWRWSPAGLTWVSYEPWGWLPYHYGSWFWDVGFGWCWSPGVYYSPAWVYWNYTPSWVGWCPIGYYGGYYRGYSHGGYYGGGHYAGGHSPRGSTRNAWGAERGTHAYPHLRGRVDVTRVDPRGWSYTSVSRIGTRLDARRDVLGQENVRFREGERGLVVTTPLRVDRGRGPAATAVQEAVRRVPQAVAAEPRLGGLEDVTPILRREGTLGSSTQEGLRRAWAKPGEDPSYRPVTVEQLASPRREGSAGAEAPRGSTTAAPGRGGERGLGSAAAPAEPAAPREAWRDGGAATTPRGATGAEPPLRGGFGRDSGVRGDDGWRSPASEPRTGTPSRTFEVPSRGPAPGREGTGTSTGGAPSRPAAPRSEPWREPSGPTFSRERPAVPDSGAGSVRREAPAPRPDEGWRGSSAAPRSGETARPAPGAEAPPSRSGDTPRTSPAPRTEAPPSRSYEAPYRSYETPRSAPAPRSEAPPSRSYEPPSRSYDAPRSAPAPRYEAPPSRSYEPPSRSYDAPRSAPAPRYEAPPSRSSSGGMSPPSSGSSRGPSGSSSAPPSGSSRESGGRSASPRG